MKNTFGKLLKKKSILKQKFFKTHAKYLFSTDSSDFKSLIKNTPSIQVRKVLPNDAPHVLRLFFENFGKCEPLAKGLQMEKNRYSPALTEFWRNSIDQGMTFAAVPKNSIDMENAFAAVVNTKLSAWDPEQWWKFASCIRCSKTKDLIGLYSFLVSDSDIHKRCGSEIVFNIANVIINEKKSKELNSNLSYFNVAKLLIDTSFKIALLRGFKMASLICTGNDMCQVAESLNLNLIYKLPYSKLLNENYKPIVKNVGSNLLVKIYTKDLSVAKTL